MSKGNNCLSYFRKWNNQHTVVKYQQKLFCGHDYYEAAMKAYKIVSKTYPKNLIYVNIFKTTTIKPYIAMNNRFKSINICVFSFL